MAIRSSDFSEKSSSTGFLKLSDADYVDYEKYSIIRLTDKGRNIGEFLMKRHKSLEAFLKSLGVKDNLLLDSELIEHHLSNETLKIIEIFNAFCLDNPDVIERLQEFKTSHP